jgi:hypothetical protein
LLAALATGPIALVLNVMYTYADPVSVAFRRTEIADADGADTAAVIRAKLTELRASTAAPPKHST